MPESKKRKKRVYVPEERVEPRKKGPSPAWVAPLMLALFGIGVLWLVVFYLTNGEMFGLPVIDELGNTNLLVGFGFIIAGFGLATQWR